MKILKLMVENYKKLRAVEITPHGEMVVITGRNGQGKTSVLDSIWAALKNAEHVQAVPIRTGADKARIKLDLGELVVERRFTPKGSTLTVEKADGARYTSPQSILDALLGALTFDPLAFVNQDPREQFDALRKIVPLEVDVDELDSFNKRDFDARTEINRKAKQLRAQAEGISVPSNSPREPIDTKALKDRMAAASKTNADLEAEHGRRRQFTSDAKALLEQAKQDLEEAERLTEQATEREARAEGRRDKAARIQAGVDALPALAEPIDADAIRAKLDAGEGTNRGIEEHNRKRAILGEAEVLEAQSSELTAMMETREIVKDEAIKKAVMPVPGLSFGDGIVTYDGVPFDQAETSAQIRVGVSIAMAMNPKLRVIRIKEGSFLDGDNLALIAEMAREHDYQVWVEKVDTSGKIGVVIEDGRVVAVDGQGVDPITGHPVNTPEAP